MCEHVDSYFRATLARKALTEALQKSLERKALRRLTYTLSPYVSLDAVAQLVEQRTFGPKVAGSNPVRGVPLTR